MRLNSNAFPKAFALFGLSATLGACALLPGSNVGDRVASAAAVPVERATSGPMADFPMVLGPAYRIDGQEYVPTDTASYDAVGYATLDRDGGTGVTIAHQTLPMPSYVEITSLETGRTILARVERRGPMTKDRIVALSPAAQAQLGSREATPVRVRRVNAPELDRAELRAGRAAPLRMDTPKSLLTVLQRKLPSEGATLLQSASAPQMASAVPVKTRPPRQNAPAETEQAAEPLRSFDKAFADKPEPNRAYPLTPVAQGLKTAGERGPTGAQPDADRPPVRSTTRAESVENSGFVIQAAAFSNETNAERAASQLDGFITKSGNLFRVRTGPFTTRGQAEAALAKVRAAGYRDARVFTSG